VGQSLGQVHAFSPTASTFRFNPRYFASVRRPCEKLYVWRSSPPLTAVLLESLQQHGVPQVIPQFAYYSKDEDVPRSSREYAGKEYRLISNSLFYLLPFESVGNFPESIFKQTLSLPSPAFTKIWQIAQKPPLVSKHFTSIASGTGCSDSPPLCGISYCHC
jgi:hypothetical protein